MGLGDIVNRILTTYKADTSDHKRAIRDLRGVEKQAYRDRLKELDQQNANIDKQIASFSKLAIGIGSAVAAYKFAQEAASAYLEDLRLESAAAGASIEQLRKSSRGLVDDDKLLAFAAQTMHGQWKLTQEQQDKVLAGAVAIRKQFGVELPEVMDKLGEAIAKGATRSLKEFGIEASSKTQLLDALSNKIKEVGGNSSVAGDDMRRAGVSMANAFDDLKSAVGEAVVALEPAVKVVADLISGLVKVTLELQDIIVPSVSGKGVDALRQNIEQTKRDIADLEFDAFLTFNDEKEKQIDQQIKDLRHSISIWEKKIVDSNKKSQGGAASARSLTPFGPTPDEAKEHFANLKVIEEKEKAAKAVNRSHRVTNDYADKIERIMAELPDVGSQIGGGFRNVASTLGGFGSDYAAAIKRSATGHVQLQEGAPAELTELQSQFNAISESLLPQIERMEQEIKSRRQATNTLFEQLFGTPADIDAIAEAISLASSALVGLRGAASAGFDAMITGSESFSKAFKKSLAEVVRSLANQMFVQSLNHLAAGFAAIAVPGLQVNASAHFKASALYGAGAVAAGIIANRMGAGGVSSSAGGVGGGAGAPSRVIGGNSSSEPSTRNVTVILGGGYEDMTERERQARLARAIRKGMRSESGTIRDA